MRKLLWLLPCLLIASTFVLAVKFSDDVLKFGTSGDDSKIIFSGGGGVIQYNNTNDRFEYANDGTRFEELGAGSPAGEELLVAHLPLPNVGNQNQVGYQRGPGAPWVKSTSRVGEGHIHVNFVDNFFERPPHCWVSSDRGVTTINFTLDASRITVFTRSNPGSSTTVKAPFVVYCMRGTIDYD